MTDRLPERAEAREAVLSLLVHVAFSDGVVQDEELAFLRGVFVGHPPDLRAWVEQAAREPLDVAAVAAALPAEEERWAALRFAAAMAWTDEELASHEKALLVEVAADLDLPRDAVEQVLDELVGRPGGPVAADAVERAVEGMSWEDVEVTPGAPADLADAAPAGWTPIAVLSVDGREAIALFEQGFVGAFHEGTERVRWESVIAYTRVPVFGAAVRIETREDDLTLTDVRLRPFATLLDRVYRG